ncbi:MAG: hypothetical protein RJA24_486, partial [Pseudomonadota bacterium]
RVVLMLVSLLCVILILWAAFGQLDIVASAPGRLVPQSLMKIVQPVEGGVVKAILVQEGDTVRQGQILARLDTTLAQADHATVSSELASQKMQLRRIEALLSAQPMKQQSGDDPALFNQISQQHAAQARAFADNLEQEKALLAKAEHEWRSAQDTLNKLEQTLPTYAQSAQAYARLEKQGFVGPLAAAEKQREATEKARDLDAQKSAVAALEASLRAQQKKIGQIESLFQSELRKEQSQVRERIEQIRPAMEKTRYRTGLTELRAPQDGIIKDLATTTVGAVVQPGTVLMTLVPRDERLFADVEIRNEDAGFTHIGQPAKIKLAAYPFQRHGMLTGILTHISADASEAATIQDPSSEVAPSTSYKARVKLDQQNLIDPHGNHLTLTPGMQVVVEIHQGKRTVMEYLLSPVKKAVQEAGRER